MAPIVQSKIIVQTIKDFRDQRQLHFVLLFMENRLQLPLFSAKCDCKTPLHNVWPFPNVYYFQHLLIWPWIAETKKEYPLRHARCGWHKFSKAFFLLITVKNRLLKLLLEIRANLKHLTDPKLGPVAQEQLDTLVRGLKWHHFCRCHSTTDVSYILWSFFMIWSNKAKDLWASKRSKSGRPSMYFIPIFLLHNTSIPQAIYFPFYRCKKNPHCLLFPVFVLA